jgi:hypothetical protein
MSSLFGSNKTELQFTMYSNDKNIQENPKKGDEFDIFTYKPTADTKTQEGKPLWFSVGGFVKLEQGQIFKGAFKDKAPSSESSSEKHFIGKFIHATFYTANILGEDKASKTHNDVAVTFEIMNIGGKEEIEKEFDEKSFDSDNSTTKITEDNSNQKIGSIEYCSVAKSKDKLLSTVGSELTLEVKSESSANSSNNVEMSNENNKIKKEAEMYIISNLVISSDKVMMYGQIEADDVFLQSLVPTKPEQKPESDGQVAVEGQAGAPAPATGAEAPAPATGAEAPASPVQPKTPSQAGGNKRKSGKKKRKSTRRRKTKRNSRIRR